METPQRRSVVAFPIPSERGDDGDMDVSAITAERDLGLLARLLQLDGQLPLPSGATVKPMLCQTDRGVWLVGGSEDESAARDLARNPTCRYESRLVGDRLHVDEA